MDGAAVGARIRHACLPLDASVSAAPPPPLLLTSDSTFSILPSAMPSPPPSSALSPVPLNRAAAYFLLAGNCHLASSAGSSRPTHLRARTALHRRNATDMKAFRFSNIYRTNMARGLGRLALAPAVCRQTGQEEEGVDFTCLLAAALLPFRLQPHARQAELCPGTLPQVRRYPRWAVSFSNSGRFHYAAFSDPALLLVPTLAARCIPAVPRKRTRCARQNNDGDTALASPRADDMPTT